MKYDTPEVRAHLTAMSRIPRYNGWTTRHYSPLEHTVIGVTVLSHRCCSPAVRRGFLFHDWHEAVMGIGDVTRPSKERYMTPLFEADVHDIDKSISTRYGFKQHEMYLPDVKRMDNDMLAAELKTVAKDIVEFEYPYNHDAHDDIAMIINMRTFEGEYGINEFIRLMEVLL